MKGFFSWILFLSFISCSSNTVHTRDLSFYQPQSILERASYQLSKPLAASYVSLAPIQRELPVTGYERMRLQGEDFLMDLGGLPIEIDIPRETPISGMYFHPSLYREKQFAIFSKWRGIFKELKNGKLCELFEINFGGKNLPELFSLPTITPITACKKEPKAVLMLLGHDVPFELEPKAILSFLARGYHVLAIHYRSQNPMPPWKQSCLDAEKSLAWLKKQINCENQDLIVYGKSFGTAPAIYASAVWKKSHIILDRPFTRMSSACSYRPNIFMSSAIKTISFRFLETFYRFPNEDWLRYVRGQTFILEAHGNPYFQGHAKALVDVLTKTKTPLEKDVFCEKNWLTVPGSSHESFWSNGQTSWYSDEKTQEKLTRFLNQL